MGGTMRKVRVFTNAELLLLKIQLRTALQQALLSVAGLLLGLRVLQRPNALLVLAVVAVVLVCSRSWLTQLLRVAVIGSGVLLVGAGIGGLSLLVRRRSCGHRTPRSRN